MVIKVRQHHIDEGERGSCQYCPIALAIKDAIGKSARIRVNRLRAYIDTELTYTEYLLPIEVGKFVLDFDRRLPVKPFQFEINLYEDQRHTRTH